jgi:DNA-binding NarL/FixJ family response regulator
MTIAKPACPPLRILLADDHPALRAGLASLLSAEPGFVVAGEAGSGEEAYAAYRRLLPDVAIIDLSMVGYGGIEAIRRIRQTDPQARLLVYSVHANETMLDRALSLGALGYVTKASDNGTLIRGIREVAQRRGFVSQDLIPAMVRRQRSVDPLHIDRLSEREFAIFLLTGHGQKPADCALTLNLSEKTIRNQLTRIKEKLGVDDTAALTRLAIRAGLVDP